MSTQLATFGAGCFWGVEHAFAKLRGVVKTAVGYAGGETESPTYRQVCNGDTYHAEVVQVTYDPAVISYAELLATFYTAHDPTTLDRQGPDHGTQYRSVIFFHTPEQEVQATQSKRSLDAAKKFRRPIVTQILPAPKFWSAEEYHQQYFAKQGVSECHTGVATVSVSDLNLAAASSASTDAASCSVDGGGCGTAHWQSRTEEEWRQILTPEQYRIARQAGTERAFSGKYWDTKTPGIYQCAACGQDLFDASTKFDSGTGWPSFYAPITPDAVKENVDSSHGMRRVESVCSRCESHLGHVFPDGPRPTGLRYCMNSASLNLVPTREPAGVK